MTRVGFLINRRREYAVKRIASYTHTQESTKNEAYSGAHVCTQESTKKKRKSGYKSYVCEEKSNNKYYIIINPIIEKH